ncbi:MAG: hypothetical protein ACYC1E_03410 [Propionibacteriaceae bacterium]
MSIADTLIAELKLLRKRPGPLTATKLIKTPMILKGLGGGNADEALSRLGQMAAKPADIEEAAAFATLGFEAEGETVLARLDAIATRHFVDQRTVRRWSDAGTDRVAQRILSASPWLEPRLRIHLNVDADSVTLSLEALGPRHVQMYEPQLTLGEEQATLDWTTASTDADAVIRRSQPVAIAWATTGIVELSCRWRGNLEAAYWVNAAMSVPARIQTSIVLREYKVRLSRSTLRLQ